jgi:preprotein translocase subunit SecD
MLSAVGFPLAQASASSGAETFSFRQVLCFAPAVRALPTPQRSSAKLQCLPEYRIVPTRLQIHKSPNGSTGYFEKVAPDPHLMEVPDTQNVSNTSGANVLLSGVNATAASVRYVLGPALLTSLSVSSADSAQINGQWVVNYGLTVHGALLWDAIARRNFHAEIAVVANGEIYSMSIIEPSQKTYTSIGGFGEISGGLSQREAMALAGQMWQPKKK